MRPLFRFACFLAGAVLLLICWGGVVTSTNAGLAVPDWPNSYGYNMFTFPWPRWRSGGVFWEHSHRLIASGVGLLTIGLMVGLLRAEPRRWVRVLGVVALVAVIAQGVLGGLRVTELKDEIGIFHAALAHAFFCLVVFLAFALSSWWQRLGMEPPVPALYGAPDGRAMRRVPDDYSRFLLGRNGLRLAAAAGVALIFTQLILGAVMRHAHADLSIRDFPLAYGQVFPPLDDATIAKINRDRRDVLRIPPTTRAQIVVQMFHRLGAVLSSAAVLVGAVMAWRRRALLPAGVRHLFVWIWPGLIAAQFTLGMFTIWTDKAADIATAHVGVGALSLALGVLLVAALSRWGADPRHSRTTPTWSPMLREVAA